MVFFPTARQTAYMAELFNRCGFSIMEIHSRKSQPNRIRTSEEFRKAKSGIMFSSDVTARGMDYPDVSLVIQMGMTQRDQYIHRLGRTARAGKQGAGVLLCTPDEFNFMNKELGDMPLKIIPADTVVSASKHEGMLRIQKEQITLKEESIEAWQAWLGFYNGQTKRLGWSTEDLLQQSKNFAKSMGLNDIPALPKRTLAKMGLSKAPGFKSEVDTPRTGTGPRHVNDKGRDGLDRGRESMSSSRGGRGREGGEGRERGRGKEGEAGAREGEAGGRKSVGNAGEWRPRPAGRSM